MGHPKFIKNGDAAIVNMTPTKPLCVEPYTEYPRWDASRSVTCVRLWLWESSKRWSRRTSNWVIRVGGRKDEECQETWFFSRKKKKKKQKEMDGGICFVVERFSCNVKHKESSNDS